MLYRIGVCASALLWPAIAAGQATPDVSFDPDVVDRRFETAPAPRAQADGFGIGPEIDAEGAPEGAAELTFALTGVVVEGATAFAAEELAPLWADLIGTEIAVATLYDLRDVLTAHYRNAGFILSRAVVPPQRINGGPVRLQVIEGYVEAVRWEGQIRGLRAFLDPHEKAILADRPLNAATVERAALLLNDLGGVTARTVLTPSETAQGASDLTFILEHDPWAASLGLNNRGTEPVGPYQVQAQGQAAGVLGLYERFTVSAAAAGLKLLPGLIRSSDRELGYIALRYDQPMPGQWATLSLSASRSQTRPGGDLEIFDIAGRSSRYAIGLAAPIIRSRRENLSVRVEAEARRSAVDIFDDGLIDQLDQTRGLTVGVTYDFADAYSGVTLVDLALNQGLPILGATEDDDPRKSRGFGDPAYTTVALTAARAQALPYQFDLSLGVTAQYAFTRLLAAQEFSYGGGAYGRAYDPATLTGDHGVAARAELSRRFRIDAAPALDFIQPWFSLDIGQAWKRGTGAGQVQPGASAAVGARLSINEEIEASGELAWPLTRPNDGEGAEWGPRFFFTVTTLF